MASNNKAFVRDVKKFLKRNSMILVALFILVVALSIFTNTFLTKDNLLSVVRQCSVEAVLAFGMALVLIIGCIDLSVSSVVALSGCICVYLIEISGFPTEVAVLLTLLFGAFCGLANGLIAAFTTIPAFIITLATQQVFRGAAYLMTNGKSIMCYDEKFGAIGTGNIGPVPILGIIIVICVIVTSVILNRTKFGRGMYAIGGNRNAAIYAGIKVRKITCLVFVMTGVLSAMSGIMLASRVYSGQPAAANGYEGNAIAAAVLGGVSFSGGVGTIGGVLIGVFIIGFMNNGLNMLHVTSYWQIIVKGLLILFAVNTRLFHFNQTSMKITWQKIILSFVLTWILSNFLGQCFVYLHKTFDIPAIDAMVHHYLHPLRDFIMSSLVTSSCYIIYLIRRQQQVIVENEQLKAENIRNQFEVLKNQLNPHMLFNSLNTLRSLVRENQDRAQDYIQELSHVLRYTLQGNESQCVTLREEMDFVSAYIFLLKMRFEDNLRFEINITHNSEEYLLPPMSIQMLIENAVKHNEISNRRPLTITIATDSEEGLLVSNPIQSKLTATTGTGIGLVNLDKRYRLLFRQEIQITEDRNFTVRIPLIRKDL